MSWFKDIFSARYPDHGTISGVTIVGLGCQTCPNRQEVPIQTAESINIQMKPTVPISIGRVILIDGQRISAHFDENIGLNQEPCKNACEYAEWIERHADRLRTLPLVAETTFEPMKKEF